MACWVPRCAAPCAADQGKRCGTAQGRLVASAQGPLSPSAERCADGCTGSAATAPPRWPTAWQRARVSRCVRQARVCANDGASSHLFLTIPCARSEKRSCRKMCGANAVIGCPRQQHGPAAGTDAGALDRWGQHKLMVPQHPHPWSSAMGERHWASAALTSWCCARHGRSHAA